jgi:hypothetical protein
MGVRFVACFLVLSAVILATDCLYVSDRRVDTTGAVVVPGRLALIEPGKTTREELASLMGPPSRVGERDDVEILTYAAQRREKRGTTIFLLLNSPNVTTSIMEHVFGIKDGVVQKYWRTES